jgi:GNAT superfamily N-acetyltransferase
MGTGVAQGVGRARVVPGTYARRMAATESSPRRATAAEALLVAELWLRSRRASMTIPPAAHSDDQVRAWFGDVVLPTKEVWVTSSGAELTAMMVLDAEWVEQLYVAPEHLRRGYGSQLARLAQATRDELALWTFEANIAARAFYEAHGFRPTGPASSDNEEHAPAICYRWARTTPPM